MPGGTGARGRLLGQVSCRIPKQQLHSVPRQPRREVCWPEGPSGCSPAHISPAVQMALLSLGHLISPQRARAGRLGRWIHPYLGSRPQFLQHCVPQDDNVQLSPTVLYRRARGWSWDPGVVRAVLEPLCVTAGTHGPASWPEGQAVRPPLRCAIAKPGPHPTSQPPGPALATQCWGHHAIAGF